MSRTHEQRQAQQAMMDGAKQAVGKNKKDRKGRENVYKCTVVIRGDTRIVKKRKYKEKRKERTIKNPRGTRDMSCSVRGAEFAS